MLSHDSRLYLTKLTSLKEAIDFLKLLFNIFELPKKVISDRGSAFTSREFDAIINSNNIVHYKVAVAAPWANGIVERLIHSSNLLCKNSWTSHTIGNKYFLSKITYIIIRSIREQNRRCRNF